MTLLYLQQELELNLNKPLKLKINDNRSTMLSVKWEPDYTKVSLHRMFLKAPQNVMQSLSCYLNESQKILPAPVKFFIEKNIKNLDYSNILEKKKEISKGEVYDLKKIYNTLNFLYFDNKLNLSITWFGKLSNTARNRVTLGLYYEPLKLIKIHRLLDNSYIPSYLIEYIIYHEMLHYVYPSYYDKSGVHRIHTPEFKKMECNHRYYKISEKWLKANQDYLFKGKY